MSFKDFDDFVDGRRAAGDRSPDHDLFAQWLANASGHAVIGGPAGEAPTVVAIPEGSSDDSSKMESRYGT